ncbi:Arylsulfatase A [Neorhodopirellula lusitana]|uniref:Arylsulfatase A n=1 Tax=Neorhodopirellula lusitana TaxID=445327 RepID=A0ABY1Q0N0_9BACT|nr:arylsulfatase [Neorhodopirellula lusitana]SMP55667.1 Arylsulfatase A [Neorhodopirellula lusitana]
MKNLFLFLTMAALGLPAQAASPPNIIYILADDMGYGDVHVLNPGRCKIATPHMDRLAAEGMFFTDAHTSSSVCTPTRYGILTGRYNWRSRLQNGVLDGYGKPLIPTDRLTVPAFLKKNGYTTAMVGKWHLGLDIATIDGKPAAPKSTKSLRAKMGKGAFATEELSNIDWTGTIQGGPVDLGFDSWYGITASLDFPPYVWIRDRNWVGSGTHAKAFRRPGPASEDFEAIDVLGKLERESVKFVSEYKGDNPFFVYIPLPSPHTPIVPTSQWKGKSGLGTYGDFVMQTDHVIGQIMKAVDDSEFADNTLVIVTADNGCSKAAKIDALEAQGHYPSAQFRGSKADLWDGGHRVPFIVRWPNEIKAGSQSDQAICLTDLMATCADLTGAKLPNKPGEDSVSFAPALKGNPIVSSRNGIIHHSISGHFAYRQGKWKLLLAKGSGGWTAPNEKAAANGGAPVAQLYDMESDPGETANLYTSQPEVAASLLAQMKADIDRGRSTDGTAASNDVDRVELWKSGQNQK